MRIDRKVIAWEAIHVDDDHKEKAMEIVKSDPTTGMNTLFDALEKAGLNPVFEGILEDSETFPMPADTQEIVLEVVDDSNRRFDTVWTNVDKDE